MRITGKLVVIITLSLGLSSAVAQNVRLSPEDSLDAVLAKTVEVRPTHTTISF